MLRNKLLYDAAWRACTSKLATIPALICRGVQGRELSERTSTCCCSNSNVLSTLHANRHHVLCRQLADVPKTQVPPPDAARGATADLCDVFHPESVDVVSEPQVQIMSPVFKDLGGKMRFSGQVATVKCYENNPLVRKPSTASAMQALEEQGNGRVLVVDAGASYRCAVLGDNLAAMAVKNGWSGLVVNGCIRDSEDIGKMDLGVKALATYPLKSSKRDPGLRDATVSFAGVTVRAGDWVYCDKDGVLVSAKELKLQ